MILVSAGYAAFVLGTHARLFTSERLSESTEAGGYFAPLDNCFNQRRTCSEFNGSLKRVFHLLGSGNTPSFAAAHQVNDPSIVPLLDIVEGTVCEDSLRGVAAVIKYDDYRI